MISNNMLTYRRQNSLQQGVLSILSNLLATSSELHEYVRAFEALDSGNDGVISVTEMKRVIKQFPNLGI
jgi:Ca2+-binding EF-hand superfamily protein